MEREHAGSNSSPLPEGQMVAEADIRSNSNVSSRWNAGVQLDLQDNATPRAASLRRLMLSALTHPARQLDERFEGGRGVAAAWIIKTEVAERRTPVVQKTRKAFGFNVLAHILLEEVANCNAIEDSSPRKACFV